MSWNSGGVNGKVLSGQQKEIFNTSLLFKNSIWHVLITELFETKKTWETGFCVLSSLIIAFFKEISFLAFLYNDQPRHSEGTLLLRSTDPCAKLNEADRLVGDMIDLVQL